MSNDIRFQFLGGGNEVGNTAIVLEFDTYRLLLDYGLAPGKPPRYPLPPPNVDLVLLTHAHLDHSGMIPWLCARQDQMILATEPTEKISNILHKDTINIAKMDGYAVPYDTKDIKNSEHHYTTVSPAHTQELNNDCELVMHPAGHIPGALMYELRGSKDILFTGDFNSIDTRLVKKAKPVKCDILFMEATYAGREHPSRDKLEKDFLDKIEEVVDRGGVAVIPAFAVARSQELAMVLRKSKYSIWFDGMGKKIAKVFLKYPRYLKSPDELKKSLNKLNIVHSDHNRKQALKSDVILTSSGMMDGGPVLWYMNRLKNDKKSAVILTGYQVEGTNSRLLIEKKKLNFYGVLENIECEVSYFDFSAHAGHSELIEFAKACEPEKIILYHSDDPTPLVKPLGEFAEVITPGNGETIRL
ncbi:MAG: MBL fold metallo-hydrolase [Candidatus Thermoplasmatota archaeon]